MANAKTITRNTPSSIDFRSAIAKHVLCVDAVDGGIPTYRLHKGTSESQLAEVVAELRQLYPDAGLNIYPGEVVVFSRVRRFAGAAVLAAGMAMGAQASPITIAPIGFGTFETVVDGDGTWGLDVQRDASLVGIVDYDAAWILWGDDTMSQRIVASSGASVAQPPSTVYGKLILAEDVEEIAPSALASHRGAV